MRPDDKEPPRHGGSAQAGAEGDKETAELLSRWREGYERLAAISERQFALVKDAVPAPKPADASHEGASPRERADKETDLYDEIWRKLEILSKEREAVQTELERLQDALRRLLGEEELKTRFERDVRPAAEKARVVTLETARKVEMVILKIGEQLGSVRIHRKAMHAYYGMDRSDQVPLYVDEKK